MCRIWADKNQPKSDNGHGVQLRSGRGTEIGRGGMRACLRARKWVHAILLAGLIVALALFVNRGRGQPLPDDLSESSEPPMVDAPNAPQSPRSPDTPFTPPPPTPFGPGQAVPFTPE